LDSTRQRCLPFNDMSVPFLQNALRSARFNLRYFFDCLGGYFKPRTAPAGTQARLKLRHAAFIELNQKAILNAVDGDDSDFQLRRWEGHRVFAIDSALIELPGAEETGREFGWVQYGDQPGFCGRHVAGRISVLTDVLNRLAVEAVLVPWRTAQRKLAAQHLERLKPEDLVLMDRGHPSYELFAQFVARRALFVCRCAPDAFDPARRLFEEGKAGASAVAWLRPDDGTVEAIRHAGLPEKTEVRFVSIRLPDGQLEVLATNMLDPKRYPIEAFGPLHHMRWGEESYYEVIQNRLGLENFTGRSVEAVRQDFHAAIFLSNLETVLTCLAHYELTRRVPEDQHPEQARSAVCFQAMKRRMTDLLLSEKPPESVLAKLKELFLKNPAMAPAIPKPPRTGISAWRSYRFQRYAKKPAF
jgi:hypothetical protein